MECIEFKDKECRDLSVELIKAEKGLAESGVEGRKRAWDHEKKMQLWSEERQTLVRALNAVLGLFLK